MEMLELYSELLLARFGLLEQMKHCEQSIAEAVNTIIYAAPRCEVKELSQVIRSFNFYITFRAYLYDHSTCCFNV
jgi:hypothetical protein